MLQRTCVPALRPRLLPLLELAALSLVGATAEAAEPVPLAIEYAAPEACPQQAQFEALVARRSPLAHFTTEPGARELRVHVDGQDGRFRGRVSISGRATEKREREVVSDSCPDVVDALALVTALAIDPNASLSLPPLETPPVTPAPVAPVAPTPPVAAPPEPPPPAPVLPPTSPPPQPPATHVSSTSSMPWRMSGGLGAALRTASAPDPLAGGAAFIELESTRNGLVAPSVRVTVVVATNGVVESPVAHVWLALGRVDGCPVRVQRSTVSLRACAALSAGAVHAEGIAAATLRPLPAERPWLDASALLRARWAPRPTGLYVDAELGPLMPLSRPTFLYEENPVRTVYQVPHVGLDVAVGAGWRFR